MLTFRKARERRHYSRREREAWVTFDLQGGEDALGSGLPGLEFLEHRLRPSANNRMPLQEAEIITYVREGTLAYEDSLGRHGVIAAGEFQRMTAGPSIRYSQTNASPIDPAHVFQLVLRPAEVGLAAGHEQKSFGVAQRRGRLCLVVSPDARQGSLHVHQDALVYSGIFAHGQHVVHELSPGRKVWLHIVDGEASVGDVVVSGGDGVGILDERSVVFTARTEVEVLLVELSSRAEEPLARSGNGRGLGAPRARNRRVSAIGWTHSGAV